jgi:hypothetical protein
MSVEKTAILALSELATPIIRQDVAAAGDDAASAAAITGSWNRVVSVPLGSGVRMPPAIAGLEAVVIRADRSNAHDLAIHAADDDAICDGSVIMLGGPRTLGVWLICISGGAWDLAGSQGALYLPPQLDGAGTVSGSAELIARTRPSLRGSGALTAVAA